MATGDYSHDMPKKGETFGSLIDRILTAPTSLERRQASETAENLYNSEAIARREPLKGRDSRRYYDTN